MSRSINTDAIIGVIFIHLLEQNKTKLSLSDLYKISSEVDIETRKRNNTIILMSTNGVYNTIENYSDLFQINNDIIELSINGLHKFQQNSLEFIDLLDSYFCAGIPLDIKSTITDKIDTFIMH